MRLIDWTASESKYSKKEDSRKLEKDIIRW